jgi:hypothetical protein
VAQSLAGQGFARNPVKQKCRLFKCIHTTRTDGHSPQGQRFSRVKIGPAGWVKKSIAADKEKP